MKFIKKIRDFLQGEPAPEVVADTAMEIPEHKADPRTLLPKDHIDYLEPENITETAHRLRVPPPSKL